MRAYSHFKFGSGGESELIIAVDSEGNEYKADANFIIKAIQNKQLLEQVWPDKQAPDAGSLLRFGAAAIDARSASRDDEEGVKTMHRAVQSFNALTGSALSEKEGWLFMSVLKMARCVNGDEHQDDYVDGAAYFALAGEAALKVKA